ncbi:tol-pal system-associated acyl-CoA thioesterase [Vibrio salinus]|uniref:tol-pal system-associated acyl-CoA thioesterase n=1 Tax=Vibrio salinus TaxID=2899784 RepID=UPI001E444283|nr:tol-pal system-associated acyl-CoA thioesterase [Vibrio salinus]MCE0492817.1 tol-pal system-associated acyl-CoA thioesterase [Vibrio salinus]
MGIFEWPVRVYYEDTDAGGVVYHANYLKFFERARTEYIREKSGVSQQSLLEQSIGFVVRSVMIDYLKGAVLDDKLTVKTHICERKKVSLTFCQELVNDENQVLCKAIVKVACINNKKMKPISIPKDFFSESE